MLGARSSLARRRVRWPGMEVTGGGHAPSLRGLFGDRWQVPRKRPSAACDVAVALLAADRAAAGSRAYGHRPPDAPSQWMSGRDARKRPHGPVCCGQRSRREARNRQIRGRVTGEAAMVRSPSARSGLPALPPFLRDRASPSRMLAPCAPRLARLVRNPIRGCGRLPIYHRDMRSGCFLTARGTRTKAWIIAVSGDVAPIARLSWFFSCGAVCLRTPRAVSMPARLPVFSRDRVLD